MFRGQKSRLAQCFVHEYRRRKYLFLIANVVEQIIKSSEAILIDSILKLRMQQMLILQIIYEVPAIVNESVYCIDAPATEM